MTATVVEDRVLVPRRLWDEAGGLEAGWRAFEAFLAPVGDALISAAAVGTGHRVIDVATGFGEQALTLRAGAGGRARCSPKEGRRQEMGVTARRGG